MKIDHNEEGSVPLENLKHFESKPSIKDVLHLEEDDDNSNTLEDGRKSKVEFQKLQIMDMSTSVVAMVGAYITILAVSSAIIEILFFSTILSLTRVIMIF